MRRAWVALAGRLRDPAQFGLREGVPRQIFVSGAAQLSPDAGTVYSPEQRAEQAPGDGHRCDSRPEAEVAGLPAKSALILGLQARTICRTSMMRLSELAATCLHIMRQLQRPFRVRRG